MDAEYPFFTWAKPLGADCLGLLAKLAGGVLIPQVAAVLHCETLVSMCDGKRNGQRKRRKIHPKFYLLLSVFNIF